MLAQLFSRPFAVATAAFFGVCAPFAIAHQGAHENAQERSQTQRSSVEYKLPDVDLVRDDGKTVSLPQEIDDGRPVVLNFIYTDCTAICPVSSQTFALFQNKLGAERSRVHMISISIDPEQDTPVRLREYARKYGAGPQWQHYTGTTEATVATQKAFAVYRGDKMNHQAVTLMRAAPGKPWLRIEGFANPNELLSAYRGLIAAK
jgi:protein SCO1